MKKVLWSVLILGVALVVAAVIAVTLFLDKGIKKGVETFGPQLTQVPVKVDQVRLSVLSGSGSISGFVLGNPAGYKTPAAMQVGSASLSLQPSSLWGDKIVVRSIRLESPEITFEGDLKGNNLSQIQRNVEAATGGPATNTPAAEGPSKKLQVDEFVVTGGKIHLHTSLLGGKSATLPLPDIRLTGLGAGPEGITAGELTDRMLSIITEKTVAAVKDGIANLGRDALSGNTESLKAAGQQAEQATQGITDLLKGKKK